jgi:hypothetical protein
VISLSTYLADLSGTLVFLHDGKSDLNGLDRRLTRTATLDGNAWLSDSGHSAADRIIQIIDTPTTKARVERARYLIKTYSELRVSLPDGAFRGVIESMTLSGAELRLRVLITGTA